MILLLAATALANEPDGEDPEDLSRCSREGMQTYGEHYLGELDGHPLLLITCRTDMFSHGHYSVTVALEWRGPEPVRTQLQSFGNAWLEGVRLQGRKVVYEVVPNGNPYGGARFASVHEVELDAAHQGTETFRDAALTPERQEEMALGVFLDSWLALGAPDPEGDYGHQLPLFEDRLHRFALDRYREGDRLLAAALVAPFVAIALPHRLPTDYPRLNDMGFFLVEVGAYEAGIPVLREVTQQDRKRAVAKLNLADAFWAVGDDRAPSLYEQYARLVERPVKRARKRSERKPPAPRPQPPLDTRARFEQAVATDDLWLAWGYALLGGYRVPPDHAFWTGLRKAQLDETTSATVLLLADDPSVLKLESEAVPRLGLRLGLPCFDGESCYRAPPDRVPLLVCGRDEWPCEPPEGACVADVGAVRCASGASVPWDGTAAVHRARGPRLCVQGRGGGVLRCAGPDLPEELLGVDAFVLTARGLCVRIEREVKCWGEDGPKER